MRNKQNLCILNEFQIIENQGGVQTVSCILKEKFEELGYIVFCAHLEQKKQSDEREFILPDTSNVNSETNYNFLYDKLTANNITIVLFQGYSKELMDLCVKIRKEIPIKLIYTYHRNPRAAQKTYIDYQDRILNNTKSHINKFFKRIVIGCKRIIFNYKCNKEIRHCHSKYDMEYIDAFISLDESYTEFFKSLYSAKFHHKFHTISNPIKIIDDKQDFAKEKNILFLARHTYQKRLDRLLCLWKEISVKFPEWKLVVVGDGEFHQEYKKIANDLKLEKVEFTGKQVASLYYKKCSIICMTSSHEGLPMTLIEAQLYNCVPIAYNSFSSANKIIVNNYNGILVKPFKQKEYSRELQKLMKDESRRIVMAQKGKEFIKKFDINNIIKHWLQLFEKI